MVISNVILERTKILSYKGNKFSVLKIDRLQNNENEKEALEFKHQNWDLCFGVIKRGSVANLALVLRI